MTWREVVPGDLIQGKDGNHWLVVRAPSLTGAAVLLRGDLVHGASVDLDAPVRIVKYNWEARAPGDPNLPDVVTAAVEAVSAALPATELVSTDETAAVRQSILDTLRTQNARNAAGRARALTREQVGY